MHFLFKFILITSCTCFEYASYSSSGGNFAVHAVPYRPQQQLVHMNACTLKLPPEDEHFAYSKHVQDVIRIIFTEVHLVGFIVQFNMMHGQYNIKVVNIFQTCGGHYWNKFKKKLHPVGSYYANLSRCTVHIMSNLPRYVWHVHITPCLLG